MNDYIIAVDRDGQPYIAHAWGRGANGQHKYIAKIGEGAKARYFYTQEQLRAFQQGARQGAQNAANKAKEKASDAVGRVRENSTLLNVGNQYRSAKQAHQNSKSSDPQKAKWGKEGYESNNTLGGKAYKAQQKAKDFVITQKSKDTPENLYKKSHGLNEVKKPHETNVETSGSKAEKKVKDTIKNTKEELQKKKEETKDKIRDKIGADEKERLEQSKKEVLEAEIKRKEMLAKYKEITDEMAGFDFSNPDWDRANRLIEEGHKLSAEIDKQDEVIAGKELSMIKAQKDYDRTLLGVADRKNKKK